jgi:hypothetical protein
VVGLPGPLDCAVFPVSAPSVVFAVLGVFDGMGSRSDRLGMGASLLRWNSEAVVLSYMSQAALEFGAWSKMDGNPPLRCGLRSVGRLAGRDGAEGSVVALLRNASLVSGMCDPSFVVALLVGGGMNGAFENCVAGCP